MTLLSSSRVKLAWVAVLGALVLSSPTQAATIFENVWVPDNGGVCSFSTTCAAATEGGDDYAANQFSVGAATTALSASFTILDRGTVATAANWAIYADVAGSPGGSALFSGTSGIASTVNGGNGIRVVFIVSTNRASTSRRRVWVSGVYWLAIQAVSSVCQYISRLLQPEGRRRRRTMVAPPGGLTTKVGQYDVVSLSAFMILRSAQRRSRPRSHSSRPASVPWVCSAGAGSGRLPLSQPNQKH